MSDKFSSLGLKGGVWEGALRSDERPARVALTLQGRTVGLADLTEEERGVWRVRAALPADTLAAGAQT